jgi:hypothetical protein
MFDTLSFTNLPSTQPIMSVGLQVTMATGESGEFMALLTSPTGAQLNRADEPVSGVGIPIFVVFDFLNTVFSETGVHRIDILFDGNAVFSTPFTVRI